MNDRRAGDGGASASARPLRVFRVEPGTSWHVLVLSREVGGIMTHWYKGRSRYCAPDGTCEPGMHKSPRFWKGYAAAQVWDVAHSLWQPVVLEVSESLEQQFRGVYKRGQVWELSRALVGKVKPPTVGVLHEVRGIETMPAPFDIRPVLCNLYHVEQIDLSARNPLPARVLVEPVAGDAPAQLGQDGAETPISGAELRAKLRGLGIPPANGHPATNGHKRGGSGPT